MEVLIYLIVALASAGGGYAFATTVVRKNIEKKSEDLLKDAEAKAEIMKNERMLQAKEKFIQLKFEHEKTIIARNQEVIVGENRIKQKESTLGQKL